MGTTYSTNRKFKRMFVSILCIFAILAIALVTPAKAARDVPTVGDQIGIFYDGEKEFKAGVPFHIQHGWTTGPGEAQAIGVFDFILEIDGEPVKTGLRYVVPNPGEEDGNVFRIYNFPQGMPEGTYTFVGLWYQPCQYAYSPADCPNLNKPVLSRTSTVTITFIP